MMDPTDWQADYETLISDCGVISLNNWSQVQLTGKDRTSFLHNMCTNDIRRLEPGQSCEAFCTDVKGKILAHVLVVAEADRLQLVTVPGQAERILTHLNRYIIREDVQLADVTADFAWSYLIGPRASEGATKSEALRIESKQLWPGGSLVRNSSKETTSLGSLRNVDTNSPAWTALRVESCWPLFGTDFDESYLPQEINRDRQAISFTKGCYLGQETIARIDALGHVNKKLALVRFSGSEVPTVGSKLFQGDSEVGTITTSTWSPQLAAPAALAVVRRGANEPGTILQSEKGEAVVVNALTAQA